MGCCRHVDDDDVEVDVDIGVDGSMEARKRKIGRQKQSQHRNRHRHRYSPNKLTHLDAGHDGHSVTEPAGGAEPEVAFLLTIVPEIFS